MEWNALANVHVSAESFEGVDLNYDKLLEMADAVGAEMWRGGYCGSLGTCEQVQGDMRCVTHYAVSSKLANILNDLDGRHLRITEALTRPSPRIHVPAAIAKAVNQIGLHQMGGRSFKPRDMEGDLIHHLLMAMHLADDTRRYNYSDYVRGDPSAVRTDLLSFNKAGDLVGTRTTTLRQKIRALVSYLMTSNDHRAFVLAKQALDCTDLASVRYLERQVILIGLADRATIDGLYADSADPDDHNHRDGVREITGDDQFDGTNGNVVSIVALRARIDAMQGVARKLSRNFAHAVRFLALPRLEGNIANGGGSSPPQLMRWRTK